MSAPGSSVYWPTVPPPKPIDAQRRVVTDEAGRPVTRARDPRVRWWEQRWIDPRGRQRRRRFADKHEAERFHEDLREAKRHGWPACPDSGAPLSPAEQRRREQAAAPTFDRVLDAFLDERRLDWAPKTFQTYEPPLRLAARWLAEAHRGHSPLVSQISRGDVKALIDRRRHTRLEGGTSEAGHGREHHDPTRVLVGDATVKNFKKALGFLFHWAVDEQLVDAPGPMPAMKLRSQDPPKRKTVPTVSDVEELVDGMAEPYGAVVLMRATTGLRPQELRPLRVSDVDTNEWQVWVQSTETPVASRHHPEGKSLVKGG